MSFNASCTPMILGSTAGDATRAAESPFEDNHHQGEDKSNGESREKAV
jgi:hypothetical protein